MRAVWKPAHHIIAQAACLILVSCKSSEPPRAASSAPGVAPIATQSASSALPRSAPATPPVLNLGTPEQNAVTICEFLAGSAFTPEERAVVQAEDAEDRRRDPQRTAQADRQVQAILARAQRSTPLQEATTREFMMNAIFGKNGPQDLDTRSLAIVASHNRVLAVNAASKTALTESSVRGILDEVQTMAAYQGRPPFSSATLATFAAALPGEYASAAANKQTLMANADSQAIALHIILNRFTAADRARYQQTASAGAVTPEMLEQAAEGTLLKADATAAEQRKADSAFFAQQRALINQQFRINISPFIAH